MTGVFLAFALQTIGLGLPLQALTNGAQPPLLGGGGGSPGAGAVLLESGGYIFTEAGLDISLEAGPGAHTVLTETGGDIDLESGGAFLTEN